MEDSNGKSMHFTFILRRQHYSYFLTILEVFLITWISACNKIPSGQPETDGHIKEFQVVRHISDYSFYKPISIAIDSPFVFIADEGDNNIVVFDWDLNWKRTLGQKGEGPGEFTRLTAIAAKDSVIAVLDIGNGRISLIDYFGELLNDFPVRLYNYGDISLTDSGTILALYYDDFSDKFIKEFSREGNILNEYISRPEVLSTKSETKARLLEKDDQIVCAYAFDSEIIGIGHSVFNWSYNIIEAYPFLEFNFQRKRKLNKRGFGVALHINGGFDLFGDYLILGGPLYNLMVVDINTGNLRALDLGPLAIKLQEFGPSTYDAVKVKGDELILVSSRCSCLVRMKLDEVIDSIDKGVLLKPTVLK